MAGPPMAQGPPVVLSTDPLQLLAATDQLMIKQQVEMMEIMTGFETQNKYKIYNQFGQEIMFAGEISGCMERCCLGAGRPFEMPVTLLNGTQVFTLVRPFRCMPSLCCCCYLQEMHVLSGQHGAMIGRIQMEWSACGSSNVFPNKFTCYGVDGAPFCTVESPCCEPWEFTTMVGGVGVGKISKKFSGFAKEIFTDADNFGCQLPPNSTPEQRAVLLGMVFMLDFCYFEQPGNSSGGMSFS